MTDLTRETGLDVAAVGGAGGADRLRGAAWWMPGRSARIGAGSLPASAVASGAPATVRFGHVFTLHEGRIIVVDSYWEAREAVEAVGLRE